MNIIEQAARRLEQLRSSGIDVSSRRPALATAPAAKVATESLQDRLARRLDEAAVRPPAAPAQGGAARPPAVVHDLAASPRPGFATARSSEVTINLDHLGEMGYLRPDVPRALISDEFRIIKRPLLMNIEGRSATPVARPNLIMVTSALPSEGKTFVSINLAISMAMELDKHVLLVDADVSRPSVLPRLGLKPGPGLLDLLSDPDRKMSDVMLRTNIDKLSLLPAGAPRGQATELLASDSMQNLLDELATRYADRIIVFDAPPLLPSTESRVLASRMGQVILVVAAGQTPQKAVTRAMAMIDACPVVMPLLNKTHQSEVGAYYGYYAPIEA